MPPSDSDSPPVERTRSASNASTLIIHGSISEAGRDIVHVESGAQASFNSYYLSHGPTATRDPDYLTPKELLDWLTMANFRSMLQDNLAKRTPGTGKAFVASRIFRSWLQKRFKTLWAYGMPGAGKTILSSIAIEYLQEQYLQEVLFGDSFNDVSSSDILVCFAYFRYTEPMSARDILAALVRQATERHAQLRPILQRLYLRHYLELTKPSYDELAAALGEMVKLFKLAFCVLDGFDEALDNVKSQLMAILSSTKIQLLVTSRPSKYLEAQVPATHRYEVYAQDQDIDYLIRLKIDESPLFRALLESNSCLQDEIVHTIQRKAAGMFLHASLQLARLQRCETISDLRDELARVPPDIDGLYTDTWNRITQAPAPDANRGTVILLWAAFAARPLCVEDLQCAMMMDEERSGDSGRKLPDNSLISLCHGLITIEKESRTVHLVHSTARDALKPLLINAVLDPHSYLASLCITRLKSCEFLEADIRDEVELTTVFKRHRLLEYAYDWWSHHVRRSRSPRIERITLDFLISCSAFPVRISRHRDFFIDFSPVHLAAWYNLPQHVSTVTGMGYRVGRQSSTSRWTALMAASYQGHTSVTRQLISFRQDRSTTPWRKVKNSLKRAFRSFDSGINAVNARGHTALMLAAMMGHANIAQMLLDAGAKVNAIDNQGYSALMAASMRGHLEVVQVLLRAPGLQVNLCCEKGTTALLLALDNEHVDVFKALLQHPEINLNGRDGQDRTPLIQASIRGRCAMVKALLQAPRTQVNLIDTAGTNALMWASRNGHHEVVEALLQAPGIKVNCRDNEGKTALIRASITGSALVVKALLQVPDIEVNAVDYKGWTALGWARMVAQGEIDWLTAVDREACRKVVDLLLQFKEGHKGIAQE
ncbi:ankyrin repeat-containing domain protein [Coprinopsis sp. MPI-PUGE-AT-0042]|nr:ankyrin repeat-containing domain protein [Coprinopsis sp. MPI-PUGE-AT-0042]